MAIALPLLIIISRLACQYALQLEMDSLGLAVGDDRILYPDLSEVGLGVLATDPGVVVRILNRVCAFRSF